MNSLRPAFIKIRICKEDPKKEEKESFGLIDVNRIEKLSQSTREEDLCYIYYMQYDGSRTTLNAYNKIEDILRDIEYAQHR